MQYLVVLPPHVFASTSGCSGSLWLHCNTPRSQARLTVQSCPAGRRVFVLPWCWKTSVAFAQEQDFCRCSISRKEFLWGRLKAFGSIGRIEFCCPRVEQSALVLRTQELAESLEVAGGSRAEPWCCCCCSEEKRRVVEVSPALAFLLESCTLMLFPAFYVWIPDTAGCGCLESSTNPIIQR